MSSYEDIENNSEWIVTLKSFQYIINGFDICYAKASDVLKHKNILPYHNVPDSMIEKYLRNRDFICTMDGNHNGATDTTEHHAQRIASLINLIQSNDDLLPFKLTPVIVYCNYIDKDTASITDIDDGWHRMRASCYLNKPIPFHLDFNE